MGNLARYNHNIARPGLLGGTIFDNFFNDFFAPDAFNTHMTKTVAGYPVADIYHGEDGSTIMEFALAGFSKEELMIDVQPEKRSITVSANTTASDNSDCSQNRRIARRSFSKTYVNYDDNLNLSAANASFENGLLTVVVPKRPETEPVQIEIR
tara:strand:- start:815 stop:1273 length:459 start_codon:yes stop_codon:yes gene_type:complete